MPSLPFQLQAITRRDRHAMIEAAGGAVRDAGGWITDFRHFSNLSVVLHLELPAGRLPALHRALSALGLPLTPPLPELPPPPRDPDEEVAGTLQITFVHDDPELRVPVPAVPG